MFKTKTRPKAATIASPEDDPAFRALGDERDQVHQRVEELSIVIERNRGRLDAWLALARPARRWIATRSAGSPPRPTRPWSSVARRGVG